MCFASNRIKLALWWPSYSKLVREITGLPLVSMSLATQNRTWSARNWDIGVGRTIDCTPFN